MILSKVTAPVYIYTIRNWISGDLIHRTAKIAAWSFLSLAALFKLFENYFKNLLPFRIASTHFFLSSTILIFLKEPPSNQISLFEIIGKCSTIFYTVLWLIPGLYALRHYSNPARLALLEKQLFPSSQKVERPPANAPLYQRCLIEALGATRVAHSTQKPELIVTTLVQQPLITFHESQFILKCKCLIGTFSSYCFLIGEFEQNGVLLTHILCSTGILCGNQDCRSNPLARLPLEPFVKIAQGESFTIPGDIPTTLQGEEF